MIPATTQHHYSFLFKKNYYKKCHYTLILENRVKNLCCSVDLRRKSQAERTCSILLILPIKILTVHQGRLCGSLAQVYSNNNIKTVDSTKEGGRVWRLSLPNKVIIPFRYYKYYKVKVLKHLSGSPTSLVSGNKRYMKDPLK